MTQPRYIKAVSDLRWKYDLFILDQWGVLHNGVNAHQGAVNAMAIIKSAGKKIILVSNSSRRVSASADGLKKFGITPDLYDHILTSGELAWEAIKNQTDPFYQRLGKKCFIISNS